MSTAQYIDRHLPANGDELLQFPSRLALRGISKQYPGCLANDSIDLDIPPGEIHALLGENGAGKSTLMKVIYGLVKPDAGEIYWRGKSVRISDPSHARRLGIGMVFQHFSLFETLTVTQNIALALGTPAKEMRALGERISNVSARYGMRLNPDRLVHTLSIGERQRVEIVRCLVQDIHLLILDEPTSVLTPQEVNTLFVTLRQLATEGCSILFISHKLHEVRALCQKATVLRAGRVSGACVLGVETTSSIARMMVGDSTPISTTYTKVRAETPFLSVVGLNKATHDPFGTTLKNLAFEVRRGEILGIAGVAGNGQEELLAALSGEEPVKNGDSICLPDAAIGHLPPDARRRMGVAFVPEERLGRGAVPDMNLRENGLLTGFMQGLVRRGMVQSEKVVTFADQIITRFKVKAAGSHSEARSLSGGNLQKFIIGREVLQNPKLLITAHPTWGVDIGAAVAIHEALIGLRDQGASILVVSEDIDELFQISDRICAIFDGRMSPQKATAETTIEEVGRWMAGDFDYGEDAGSAASQVSKEIQPC
ncbi:ABC transporter ATP-binding protein [Zhongshania sp.]|uniref:ABC transporter ATP-binding protein n=1 Tax=Zhongshania sp. TaxID=1971902 RepID=UPI0035622CCB